jgi:uncharacterized membrane protein
MAALAYLLLPVTGLVAYLMGGDRARAHGLQAIAIGLLWPLSLYAAALGPAVAVQAVFGLWAVVWLAFLVATALGRDPRLPLVGSLLFVVAAQGTKDAP